MSIELTLYTLCIHNIYICISVIPMFVLYVCVYYLMPCIMQKCTLLQTKSNPCIPLMSHQITMRIEKLSPLMITIENIN